MVNIYKSAQGCGTSVCVRNVCVCVCVCDAFVCVSECACVRACVIRVRASARPLHFFCPWEATRREVGVVEDAIDDDAADERRLG